MSETVRVDVGEVELSVVLDGPADGPLVVLLHGFPEYSLGWRYQIPALAAAGFRVAAPDQRGCGASDKPRAVRAYRRPALVADVVGLVRALGRDRCSLVGHDWGGVVSWTVAVDHPELVECLCVLNCPHPTAMGDVLRRDPDQRRRSRYMAFFQLPLVPEWYLRRDGWRKGLGMLRSTSLRGTFTDEDLARYREVWEQDDTLTTMLNWYRAAGRYDVWRRDRRRVKVPVRVLWGTEDRFLGRALAEASVARCDDGELQWLEGATHWLAHEKPDEVNAWLTEQLRAAR